MKKRRISLRMENNEAAVVAPLDWWKAIEKMFREAALQEEDVESSDTWREAAHHIGEWVERTRDKRDDNDGQ